MPDEGEGATNRKVSPLETTTMTKPPKRANWSSPKSLRNRIHSAVDIDDNGCWLWRPAGSSGPYAYATHRVAGKVVSTAMHRVSYEVKRCVNPTHLEPVTNAENIRRGYERKAVTA